MSLVYRAATINQERRYINKLNETTDGASAFHLRVLTDSDAGAGRTGRKRGYVYLQAAKVERSVNSSNCEVYANEPQIKCVRVRVEVLASRAYSSFSALSVVAVVIRWVEERLLTRSTRCS